NVHFCNSPFFNIASSSQRHKYEAIKTVIRRSPWRFDITISPSSPLLFHPFLSDYLTLKCYFATSGAKGRNKKGRVARERRRRAVNSETRNPPLPLLSPGPQSQPENTRIGEHPTAKDYRESCGFRQGDEVGVKPARLPAAAVAPNTVVQLLHPATFHSPAFDSPSPPMLTT
ncbi:unnamed protein product, partial [Heterotrigona itama]